MKVRICGGRVIDPGNLDGVMDILVDDGRIVDVRPHEKGTESESDIRVINASGRVVIPGLIDMHVHLREPGHEHKETIESGCSAAAAGGFTGICPMPNTLPVNDREKITQYILEKARLSGKTRVYPVSAISKGLLGKELCDLSRMHKMGSVAFSDDGCPVTDSKLMRRALEAAKELGVPIISHCEELSLGAGATINQGDVSLKLGLPGIPNAVESSMVMRDLDLAERTGAHVHIAHVSTAESVRAIRNAKALGVPVTAETAPHYFILTDDAVLVSGTHAKMNPPLRSVSDREAIREGLRDGTLDAIATDHAPHSTAEKKVGFDLAANGIIGLETSVPLSLTLVEEGLLTLSELVEKMSSNPARILGFESGIKIGGNADITLIDTDFEWTVDAAAFRSLSRNTPFDGWKVKGKAVMTMVGGRIVYEDLFLPDNDSMDGNN